jgi:hypothetical protein
MAQMKRARKMRRSGKSTRKAANERLIRTLVAGCGSPAQALELYYWSREPGLVEIIRGVAMMSEQTRAAIEAFIALARDTKSVMAVLDRSGVLRLASAEAARTVALAQGAAAGDGADVPQLRN